MKKWKKKVQSKKILVYSFDQNSNGEDVDQLFLKAQYINEKKWIYIKLLLFTIFC